MCDSNTFRPGAMTRRGFGAFSSVAFLAACTTTTGDLAGTGVVERAVNIASPDGTIDGFFYYPASGAHAAAIMWPDVAGIRPASKAMARRLAGEGFAVVLANPYYRDVAGQQFADFAELAEKGFATVAPWRENHTAQGIARDARALIAWLDAQPQVDTGKPVSAAGYCMTGAWPTRAAHAVPSRMGAAASLHGGGLVTQDANSPHKQIVAGKRYLYAIAQDDNAKAPGEQSALSAAADAVDAYAEVTVYPADHGWTVPDSPAYDEVQAEAAWARMLAVFTGIGL